MSFIAVGELCERLCYNFNKSAGVTFEQHFHVTECYLTSNNMFNVTLTNFLISHVFIEFITLKK